MVREVVLSWLKNTTKVFDVLFNRLVPLKVASLTSVSSCVSSALNWEARPARVVVSVGPSAWGARTLKLLHGLRHVRDRVRNRVHGRQGGCEVVLNVRKVVRCIQEPLRRE